MVTSTTLRPRVWVKSITDVIAKAGGSVHGKPDWWGKRQFAYPINKKEYGYYVVINLLAARRRTRRARALLPYRRRHRPPQVAASPRCRGGSPRHGRSQPDTSGVRTPLPEGAATMADNTVTLVGNLTHDPELRFTTGGRGHGQLRPRRQPSLPGEQRMAGADLVLQRGRLGHSGRERCRVAQQGHPHHRHRSSRAASVRDQGRREAFRRRDRRRRDRPVPALGPCRGRAHRSRRRR